MTDDRYDPLYPDGDGRPFDSDWHFDLLADTLRRLKQRYAGDPNTYVSGWLVMYFEKGNPDRRIAPDVFVVRGVPNCSRRHYLLWREGVAPQVAIEFTSELTAEEDWHEKLPVYRDILRVPEVFIFDPLKDYLDPPLQGFRLANGEYRPIEAQSGRLASEQLDLWLKADDVDLALIDRMTGCRLPGRNEPITDAWIDAIEAENARLEAEITELKRQLGGNPSPEPHP